jgi:hypothetical protein
VRPEVNRAVPLQGIGCKSLWAVNYVTGMNFEIQLVPLLCLFVDEEEALEVEQENIYCKYLILSGEKRSKVSSLLACSLHRR